MTRAMSFSQASYMFDMRIFFAFYCILLEFPINWNSFKASIDYNIVYVFIFYIFKTF